MFSYGRGRLWILDPAAPGYEFNLDGGPKLVRVDLKADRMVQVIRLDRTDIPPGSYLNDLRISPAAYLTNRGINGALLSVDLKSGSACGSLELHASTQVEPIV